MSRWDELDRMQERVEEGRRRIQENNAQRHVPTEAEVSEWQAVQERILEEVRQGATSAEIWKLNNGWIEVRGGRQFHLKESLPEINDDRIRKYLQSHGVSVEADVVRSIRREVFSLSANQAKQKLKSLILNFRKTGTLDLS